MEQFRTFCEPQDAHVLGQPRRLAADARIAAGQLPHHTCPAPMPFGTILHEVLCLVSGPLWLEPDR